MPLDASSTREFTRHGVATRHCEHASDGVGVRWVPVVVDPLPDRPGAENSGRSREFGGIGRVDRRGELVEVLVVGAQQVGGAGEQDGHITLGDVVEQGEHLVTDPVAAEAPIVVAGVLGDDEAELLAQCGGLEAPKPQDRVAPARTDRAESGRSGAAQEREEDRLGLIVERVAGHRLGSECGVSGGPRPRLEVGSVVDVDVDHTEADPEAVGDGAGDVGVDVGRVPQAVMDVNGRDVTPGRDGERDERARVRSSGEAARDGGSRRRKRAPVQEVGGVVQCNASLGDL